MRRCKSDAYEAIYEEVMAEFEAGLISEAERKKYDEICLVEEKPEADYASEKSTVLKHVTA